MHARQKWCFSTLALFLVVFSVIGFASAEGDPDIHYVPTPQYVVNELLEIAETNKDDIVYDLGCGDGRFVITAAKKYGARGVGIDIDPERIRESQTNAMNAGVADRVKFIEADLFKTDVSRATIVALYLLPQLNLRLRPKLFKELKPGTRIVSHDFDMDDWTPDIAGGLGSSLYYLWILPADVEGTWNVKISPTSGIAHDYQVQLTQKFQELMGRTISRKEEIEISSLKLKGDAISFFLSERINQWKVDMHFKGRVEGDSLSGSVQIEGGPYTGLHTWTAVRN
ncbi:MAG: class I SAM-dependent methyltransferase [Deltaproteobacteria bacterium]|nr:class I SAM-dependent methyltransferase [Deltaproteobacteria bacterium]